MSASGSMEAAGAPDFFGFGVSATKRPTSAARGAQMSKREKRKRSGSEASPCVRAGVAPERASVLRLLVVALCPHQTHAGVARAVRVPTVSQ
eukprot:697147-Prymnesium_polylepis.1